SGSICECPAALRESVGVRGSTERSFADASATPSAAKGGRGKSRGFSARSHVQGAGERGRDGAGRAPFLSFLSSAVLSLHPVRQPGKLDAKGLNLPLPS